MSTSTYAVTGTTCGHCVQSVTGEVSEVPRVTAMDVDLASGRVAVPGAGLLTPMIPGAAMAFSSVFVLTNSLRPRGFRPLRSSAEVTR